MSVDMNVGKLLTRQILPGISASNSIAVVQSGKGADVGGLIGKAGLSLSVSLNKSEGFHQAVRSLIELSTIEILGKLTQVPYWRCLSIESTNPNFRAEARTWYDSMSIPDRSRFVSTGLVRSGYFTSVTSEVTPELSEAVARYQAQNDLVPNGQIDFDLYYRLLASDQKKGQSTAVVPAATPVPAVAQAPSPAPTPEPQLRLTTARGERASYRIGDTMSVAVQPAQDSFVYCYYQDSGGTVARLFPNRFQPDAFLHSGARLVIPPAGRASFSIRFDPPGGQERVACFGANREVGLNLPASLKVQDLQPLPVQGLDDIAKTFRSMPGVAVADSRLAVEVSR